MKAILATLFLTAVAPAVGQEAASHAQYLRSPDRTHTLVDPRSVELKDDSDQFVNRRKFVRYESSRWEQMWLDNIDRWATEGTICTQLNTPEQMQYMHDFMTLLCTARYEAPYNHWCKIDDDHRPLWYNTANRTTYDLSWIKPVPDHVSLTSGPQPVVPGPEHEHVVSKLTFRDDQTGEEYVEYIEPLVSHLRFPLVKCTAYQPIPDPKYPDPYLWHSIIFKGYVIPPPPGLRVNKKWYFDAGASDWNNGHRGSSLVYFHDMWLRHGHVFDGIYAYEIGTTVEDFYETTPVQLKERVHYQQCAVVSSPEEEVLGEKPFLPAVIKRVASAPDYVLFKLDIDMPNIEQGTIDFILNDPNNFIDEIAWEHHITGNYLMPEWGVVDNGVTLRQSYELFLKLRQKGIRSHSWI